MINAALKMQIEKDSIKSSCCGFDLLNTAELLSVVGGEFNFVLKGDIGGYPVNIDTQRPQKTCTVIWVPQCHDEPRQRSDGSIYHETVCHDVQKTICN